VNDKSDQARMEVERILDEYLRPYIATHGGIVEVVDCDFDLGIVTITMEGGCSGCPASLVTLRYGIETTLKEHLSWVKKVTLANEPVEPDFGIKLE
jgi:Fe-S cluster biogenesis protein NfuA